MADAHRDLLFGLLALQNGMIDQAKLVAAFQAWTLEKDRPLAEQLVGRGDLETDQRSILEAMVELHLRKHAGSAQKSLAAVPAVTSTRETLQRIADHDLATSLALLGQETAGDGAQPPKYERTVSFAGVTLAETDHGPEPPIVRDGGALFVGSAGRYQILGEIARGGMGAVLRGHDPDLGRDLALKVLLDQHRERADLIDRFVEEAQICGQLQHPGVVPVYELGSLADRRPFFAMKLVKGQTLAVLLARRSAPADDLPRFLSIFEAVCQTVAYAHSRGVIHRDLKPSNVMVGSFGEVQVMDWGLAKVLPKEGQPGRASAPPQVNETIMATVRSKGDSELSQAGSVLGTPAYMAPEQARGESDAIDRRADVFALGSLLCEILTGSPAFQGGSANEILRAAGRAETAAALDRLARCQADDELLTLARDCLAAEARDRPTDAGVVAARVTGYLAGVQDRLRNTELACAAEAARAAEAGKTAEAAEAKAAAERRARRLTGALAATVLLAGGLVGAGWRWVELDRLNRTREATAHVNAAVQEATRLRGEAQGAAVGDLGSWTAAVAAAEKARDLLVAGVEPGVRKQVEDLAAEVGAARGRAEAVAEAADRDRRLLDRLVDIRSAKTDDRMGDGTDEAYGNAFREAGIDPDALTPEEARHRIQARPPDTATAMAMALDDWAAVRRDLRSEPAEAKRLSTVARLADPDAWRNRLRDALDIADRTARRDRLTPLIATIQDQALPPVSFDLLGQALGDVGAWAEAESVLRRGCRVHPGDVWLNYDLARALQKLSRREEAIRYYTAARMIRPETAHELAHALLKKGESEEGIGVFRDLVRIRPGSGRHLSCLGEALLDRGLPEATQTLSNAIAVLRKTISARPGDFHAHLQLGNALMAFRQLDEALAMYREAARLKPGYADAFHGSGMVLESKGRYDEAIEAYEQALRLAPDDGAIHSGLSGALRTKGRLEEALLEAREAVRLSPDDPDFLQNLGQSLAILSHFDEAEAAFRKSLANKPDNAYAINSLAWLLATAPEHAKHDPREAVTLARKAVELGPQVTTNVNTLGIALYRAGMLEEAIATLRQSALLDRGKDASDWFFLSMACWRHGELGEAEDYYVRAVATLWRFPQPDAHYERFWAEAAELFGAFGPGPVPFLINTDPDRAMVELRRAVAAGNVDRQRLKEDPGLDPLRSRPDFRPLIDLAIPGQPTAK